MRRYLVALVVTLVVVGVRAGEPQLELRNERLMLAVGQAERGAIVALLARGGRNRQNAASLEE